MADAVAAVGDVFGSGENGEHAGRALGRTCVDPTDARVGMRRADEDRVGLIGQREVVSVASLAAHEAQVLEAGQRLADIAGGGAAIGHGLLERLIRVSRYDRATLSPAMHNEPARNLPHQRGLQ